MKTAFSVFTLGKSIGDGGNGIVYEGIEGERRVAIKVLRASLVSDREKLKRFKNEYSFCAIDRHKNIVRVLESGVIDPDIPFFVMPLYDGSIRKLVGTLEEDEAFSLVSQILDGVEAYQKYGVIHRDLKPENVLFRNNRFEIAVTDFGIAEFGQEELYTAVETKAGARMANFLYAAPEQKVRGGKITKATDIYALGLIINEIFTGAAPLAKGHNTISSVSQKYGFLDEVVDVMLQQDPLKRYQTVEEIKRVISVRSEVSLATQKIGELSGRVIPVTEVEDPILNDPMRIIDTHWENNQLFIKVNHTINQVWMQAMNEMSGHHFYTGLEPHRFGSSGDTFRVGAQDLTTAQMAINCLKSWLPIAQKVYERLLVQQARSAEESQRKSLREELERQQKHMDINAALKI